MTGRRRITLTIDGSIVVARGWRASDLIAEAGVKATFSGSAAGFMFDRRRLPDIEAYLQHRGIPVVVVDPDQLKLDPFGGDAA